ncbi:Naringenin,2-oxoglutarate 3-dioxygenase [Acorus calamus]|uniref:Naringenin,2-oxoglutarate 3-dioxygenase n=1 Tax=Acorus calamus TaxID=4465 RepID=A0AAV9FE22_ACOCL|nr:Naringenin,2-oxoglutarate 3-dioxygenase [Acorus calamus]
MALVSPKVLLSDLINQTNSVPSQYIRPVSDRPNLDEVDISNVSIPLIDLSGIDGPNRPEVVKAIGLACQTDGQESWDPRTTGGRDVEGWREFFRQPESERMKSYSDDPNKLNRLSTSFNVRTEKVSNWRDFLRLHCFPLEDFIHEWPSNPPSFREVVGEYSKKARELSLKLMEAISESLGLHRDHMVKALGKQAQHMAVNYYPPCPQPELTYGLPGHKDPNALTLLLQDGVSGLQVLRNGKWVAVNPIPNTFVINIGDQIQVLSNDRYKSVLHRAVVNCDRERLSVPTFYCPSRDALIEPAKELVDQEHPLVYRSFTYAEYFDKFWNRGLRTESCLDMFKAPDA